jgi:hypothetical protein
LNSAGDIVAIGARNNWGSGDNSGHVRVHQYNIVSKLWERLGIDIDGEDGGDNSGFSVSMNSAGNIVAIGAVRNDGENGVKSGHTRVWEYKDGTWQKLGQDIDGAAKSDFSGVSVSMNNAGDIVTIGAQNNDGSGVDGSRSGHVRVWEYNIVSKLWEQLGNDIDGEDDGDNSGKSVSMNDAGDIVAIGVENNDENGVNSGHVRIYQYIVNPTDASTKIWDQLGDDIDGEDDGDSSGKSVSMNGAGNIVLIGAPDALNENGIDSGHVRVFYYRNGIWNQALPGFFKVSNGFLKLSGTSFFKV